MAATVELPEEARKLLERYAENLSGDLEALVDTPVRVSLEAAGLLDARAAAAEAGEGVHALLEPKGGGEPLHVWVPAADAVTLGGLLLGQDADAIRAARKSAPEQEVVDAFGEVLNMAGALLGRVLAEGVGAPELERGEMRVLPPDGGEFLPPGACLRIRYALRPEGLDPGHLDLFVPQDVAAGWWTLRGAPVASGAGAEAPDGGESSASLAVFEGDPDERDRVEDLGEELGFEVVAYEYGDWGEDLVEELAEARAVVVSFDLGGRSGIELIETLAARPELARVALLLADEAPTRALLRAAFRAGAHGFVQKPWCADELAKAVARARAVVRACLGEDPAEPAAAPTAGGDPAGAGAPEGAPAAGARSASPDAGEAPGREAEESAAAAPAAGFHGKSEAGDAAGQADGSTGSGEPAASGAG